MTSDLYNRNVARLERDWQLQQARRAWRTSRPTYYRNGKPVRGAKADNYVLDVLVAILAFSFIVALYAVSPK